MEQPSDLAIHAYIDESGTNTLSLEKENTSKYFIHAATVVNEKDLEETINQFEKIRKSNNRQDGQELKSSKIDIGTRKKILTDIVKLPIGFYIFIVDKKYVNNTSGLFYKKSFYKYASKKLIQMMSNEINCKLLKIFSDEIGSKDFMDTFDDYYKKNISDRIRKGSQYLLFEMNEWQHKFLNSKENHMIEISDIIAGTILKYHQDKGDNTIDECYKIIEHKIKSIERFPPKLSELDININDNDIYNYQNKKCNEYLETNYYNIDKYVLMRVETLITLLHNSNEKKSLYAASLLKKLKETGCSTGCSIGKRNFTSNVIGKLREYGIIISGSKQGYKIARTREDVAEYLNHDESIIFPMFEKLNILEKIFLEESLRTQNLFDKNTKLYSMLEAYKKEK